MDKQFTDGKYSVIKNADGAFEVWHADSLLTIHRDLDSAVKAVKDDQSRRPLVETMEAIRAEMPLTVTLFMLGDDVIQIRWPHYVRRVHNSYFTQITIALSNEGYSQYGMSSKDSAVCIVYRKGE